MGKIVKVVQDEQVNYPNKQYLGDGAYIQLGSFTGEIVLTTENGISVQNRVVLGPVELVLLRQYLEENQLWEKS